MLTIIAISIIIPINIQLVMGFSLVVFWMFFR